MSETKNKLTADKFPPVESIAKQEGMKKRKTEWLGDLKEKREKKEKDRKREQRKKKRHRNTEIRKQGKQREEKKKGTKICETD